MLRIIKFRGKQINTDEWVYGHLFYGKNEQGQDEAFIVSLDYYCRDGLIDLNTCASWQVDIDTVGQLVGEGEYGEIYEGMKLYDEYAEEYCTIEYDEKDYAYRIYYDNYSEILESLDGLRILTEEE